MATWPIVTRNKGLWSLHRLKSWVLKTKQITWLRIKFSGFTLADWI